MKRIFCLAIPFCFASTLLTNKALATESYRCDAINAANTIVATTHFAATEFGQAKAQCIKFMEDTLPGQQGRRNWELNPEIYSEPLKPGYRCQVYNAVDYDRADNLIGTYFTSAETNQERAVIWCKSLFRALRPKNSQNWETILGQKCSPQVMALGQHGADSYS